MTYWHWHAPRFFTRWWKPFLPTNACVTWLIHICYKNDLYVYNDSIICVPWLIVCVTWLTYTMTQSYVCHDLFISTTWIFHMCDVTQSHVPHIWMSEESCLTYRIMSHVSHIEWVTSRIWKIHVSSLSHIIWTSHVPHIWMTKSWIFRMCDVTHSVCETRLLILYVRHDSYVWHDLFISTAWIIHDTFMITTWTARPNQSCMFPYR